MTWRFWAAMLVTVVTAIGLRQLEVRLWIGVVTVLVVAFGFAPWASGRR